MCCDSITKIILKGQYAMKTNPYVNLLGAIYELAVEDYFEYLVMLREDVEMTTNQMNDYHYTTWFFKNNPYDAKINVDCIESCKYILDKTYKYIDNVYTHYANSKKSGFIINIPSYVNITALCKIMHYNKTYKKAFKFSHNERRLYVR